MGMFFVDSASLDCTSVDTAKQWWIRMFDCRAVTPPEDWDDPLPSDVALIMPGEEEPTILLTKASERRQAGLAPSPERPIVFCRKAKKAHSFLERKGANPGPIEEQGGAKFFEIRDPEGTVIEICEEP